MLYGQGLAFLRSVEHIEDYGPVAAVLAVVGGIHHLHDSLALVYRFLLSVLSNDGQVALYKDSEVHDGMVVPSKFLSGGNNVFHRNEFGFPLGVVG